MSILILMPNRQLDCQQLAEQLLIHDNTLNIDIWPDVKDKQTVEFAIVWKHPDHSLLDYPNLKSICSYGAGVDFIFKDPGLPTNIDIARIIDQALAWQMSEYLLSVVLAHKRNLLGYKSLQTNTHWQPLPLKTDPCNQITILGMGVLGQCAAKYFKQLHFQVNGFSQSAKSITGINHCHNLSELKNILRKTDYLINLLPATNNSQHFVDKTLLKALKPSAYFINAGRGATVNDQDLLDAINNQQLAGACLDVFQQEPLASDHPFWQHEKILMTPHIASLTDPIAVAKQLFEQYQRSQQNQPLLHQVDSEKGY